MLVEGFLRQQATALAAAGELSQLEQCVRVHEMVANSLNTAATIFDAMKGSEETFLKLGHRQQEMERISDTMMNSIVDGMRHEQVPEFKFVEEMSQKLSSVQSSEGLKLSQLSAGNAMAAMCKLAAES